MTKDNDELNKILVKADYIRTSVDEENILLTTDIMGNITKSVVNLQEEAVRKVLIDIGWTPPERETRPEPQVSTTVYKSDNFICSQVMIGGVVYVPKDATATFKAGDEIKIEPQVSDSEALFELNKIKDELFSMARDCDANENYYLNFNDRFSKIRAALTSKSVDVEDYLNACKTLRSNIAAISLAMTKSEDYEELCGRVALNVELAKFTVSAIEKKLHTQGYLGGVMDDEDQIEKTIPPRNWYIFDGIDKRGLIEILDNVDWNCFQKIGQDKNHNRLIFLKDENDTAIFAIKCKSDKIYSKALNIIRDYLAAPEQKEN